MEEPDDLARNLRATLRQRAEDAPTADLADAALRQAGRIRSRRRASALTAVAVAAVAIAIPVGVEMTGDSGAHRDVSAAADGAASSAVEAVKPTRVRLAGLPLGDEPAVPYVHGDQYTTGGQTVTLKPTSGRIVDAAPLANGPAVWSLDSTTGRLAVSANGGADGLPEGASASNPAYDAQSGETAWAVTKVDPDGEPSRDDTVVLADDVDAPRAAQSTLGLRVQHVMGVHDAKAVVNATDQGLSVAATVDLESGDVTMPWAHVTTVTAVDPEFTRLAVIRSRAVGGSPRCSSMLAFDDASEQWSSCLWRPVEFSLDGARVLAVASNSDGFAVRELAVMDATSGSVLGEFTTRGGFGRATFEGSDTVLAVVVEGEQAAIVRCRVAGGCELATKPAAVAADDPASLVTPYQLTVN